MADEYFVGLRATGDLASDERSESWRPGILRLFPNGDMPLTGLTNLMKTRKTDDFHFHWWTKTLMTQRAAITGIYTDVVLGTGYSSGGVAGQTLYVKMSAADTAQIREGHQVLLRAADYYDVDCVGKITAVVVDGASSYCAVRLLEDDDNGTVSSKDLSDADTMLIVGNINPQGGTRPDAITQSPSEFSNYTQIFRNPLDLARTLRQTKLRTEDAYKECKRDCLEQHGVEMEKAFLWGVASLGTGNNGKPEATTQGLIPFIKNNGGVVEDYSLDSDTAYDGKTWIQAGEQWIDEHLEEVFRYGADEKLAFCGSGALLGINRAIKAGASYQLQPMATSFGLKVVQWVTPFGSIMLKRHPLFTYEATNRHTMLIFEPADLEFVYVQDTIYQDDPSYLKGGGSGKDGVDEEFLTEAGLEFHHPEKCAYLNGVGEDNPA